jgi:hypothetical protein
MENHNPMRSHLKICGSLDIWMFSQRRENFEGKGLCSTNTEKGEEGKHYSSDIL